jgi:hypothetical protein
VTWQSLLDWVLRNIRAISLLPLGVAILAVIVKALSMRKEWLSTLVAGLPQLTWQRSSGKESPDFFELIRSALQVGFREVKAFCRSHVKQISILFAITAAVVGAANVALSLSDNEEKAKSAGLKLPDPVCSRKGNTQLLIFFHGWNGDPDATWKKFPALACADPTLTGVDVLVVDYPTYAKRRNLTIAALARWVNEEIRRVESQKAEPAYTKVAIVAHSMGGLIGREIAIIRKLGNQQPIGVNLRR